MKREQEARIVDIEFSAAVDRVNRVYPQGIFFKLSYLTVGGSVPPHCVSLIGHSLSWWMDVGANWLMWWQVPQWRVFGPELFLPHNGAYLHT